MSNRKILRIFAGIMVLVGIVVALLLPWDCVLLEKSHYQLIQNPNGTKLVVNYDEIPDPLPSETDELYNYHQPTAQSAVEWVFPSGIGLTEASRDMEKRGITQTYVFPVDKIYEVQLPQGCLDDEKVQWSYLSMRYAALTAGGKPFYVILHTTENCATCHEITETYRSNEANGNAGNNILLKNGKAVLSATNDYATVNLAGKDSGIYFHCSMELPVEEATADYLNQFGMTARSHNHSILLGYRAMNIWRTVAISVAAAGLILGALTFIKRKRSVDAPDEHSSKDVLPKGTLLRILAGIVMLSGLVMVLLQPWSHILWEGRSSRIVQSPGYTELIALDAEDLKSIPDSCLGTSVSGKTMEQLMDRLLIDNSISVWAARSIALSDKSKCEIVRLDMVAEPKLPNDMTIGGYANYVYGYWFFTINLRSADKKSSEISYCLGDNCNTCAYYDEVYQKNHAQGKSDMNLKLSNGKAMITTSWDDTDGYVSVKIWGKDGSAGFHGNLKIRDDQFNADYLNQFGMKCYPNDHACLRAYRLSEMGRLLGTGLLVAGIVMLVYSCRRYPKKKQTQFES